MWLWSSWVCQGCGATLRRRLNPRLLVVPALLLVSLLCLALYSGQVVPTVLAGAVALHLLASCVILAGNHTLLVADGPKCRGCGYDLSTQPAGAPCPECGASPPLPSC